MAADENMPAVKHHREREYAGMFEYRKDDEPLLIRNLIIGKTDRRVKYNGHTLCVCVCVCVCMCVCVFCNVMFLHGN